MQSSTQYVLVLLGFNYYDYNVLIDLSTFPKYRKEHAGSMQSSMQYVLLELRSNQYDDDVFVN